MDRLLDVNSLAEVLGLTPRAVRARLERCSTSIPPPVRLPGSSSVRWRQPDVEVWLAALPVRTVKRAPPRSRKGKHPALTGEHAIWEKYLDR